MDSAIDSAMENAMESVEDYWAMAVHRPVFVADRSPSASTALSRLHWRSTTHQTWVFHKLSDAFSDREFVHHATMSGQLAPTR